MFSLWAFSVLTLLVHVSVSRAAVGAWGQCGGQTYTGETTCIAGYSCTYSNPWYSQCLPSPSTSTSKTSSTVSTLSSISVSSSTSTSKPTSSTSKTTSTSSSATATSTGINTTIPRATYTEITNFGTNPTGVRAWIYVPQNLAAKPALIVGLHWCHGDANAFYTGTQFKYLADQKGFIVIYPQTPNSDGCWDVHTNETLTHNGGGDSLGVVSAVRWTIPQFNVDTSRIFAVGTSSGAMMTNVLIGAYPDIFAAGSANAGVPFACFQGPDSWNGACATGTVVKTAQQWGDLVRNAYPGYTGKRPRMQFWHGTGDQVLYYTNFGEEVKQWTNVHGVSTTPTSTTTNYVFSGWTRYDYGPNVSGISAQGVSHDIQLQAAQVLEWFGL